jgi:hypothetical protein
MEDNATRSLNLATNGGAMRVGIGKHLTVYCLQLHGQQYWSLEGQNVSAIFVGWHVTFIKCCFFQYSNLQQQHN